MIVEDILISSLSQDQSGRLNLSEVECILSTLLTMENVDIEECSQKEIILDIFRSFLWFSVIWFSFLCFQITLKLREMDSNGDGRINKKEFVETAMSSELLLRSRIHS